MKMPKKPIKPRLPSEPQKTITLFEKVELGTVNFGNTTLGDITHQIKHLLDQRQLSHDSAIHFCLYKAQYEMNWYDEPQYEIDTFTLYCAVEETVENERYKSQYKKYSKQLAAYELACKRYEEAMVVYTKQMKEYEADSRVKELADKQKYMRKLEKDIEKLKKQVSDA